MIYLIIPLFFGKLIIVGLLIDRRRLKKKLEAKLEGPVGYMCNDDFMHELDPDIADSEVIVYNDPEYCYDDMGEAHAEESGIAMVRLVKIKDFIKGERKCLTSEKAEE